MLLDLRERVIGVALEGGRRLRRLRSRFKERDSFIGGHRLDILRVERKNYDKRGQIWADLFFSGQLIHQNRTKRTDLFSVDTPSRF
jgi:hypothetical protein